MKRSQTPFHALVGYTREGAPVFAGQLDVVVSAGAGFLVVLTCDMMRMSGPPKRPQSEAIDLVDGVITGLR